jgi:hypothetical protein
MTAAVDDFASFAGSPLAGAGNIAAVTPSDTVDLTDVTRWVWVGGAGNLVVITAAGQTVTITGIAAGTLLPIRVSRVKATLTTATNILALW